ncbi:class I SAM-dependent methyltransferase [Photobacterium lipolyticum]|uniref:SAM-dependent methyltransferase n=1 Tax=Photobacterium lipolyticum TaxID=266810 RepID=A0A2T3MV37_9GAMM|nr:class I SAM-dependent methyltransferase [Photobacterium lipolyticum]PSW03797.1 SAM-dependent methyltransferase [Photobacterium lipolyticum]
MFKELTQIHQKPEVFSVYTTDKLWTEPYLANQMLKAHLSQDTPMASRPMIAIDRVVAWLDAKFGLNGKSICDLGCGPGLYAEKYAQLGAKVHGLDFSDSSIQYAKGSASKHQLDIIYEVANYLEASLPSDQDLVTLIYCDLCALSPTQRQKLYSQVRECLKPNGRFIFDVSSIEAFDTFAEHCSFAPNYMHRFWSNNKYYAFHNAFRYEDDRVSLDHYTIIEDYRTWHIYNWMQYFTHESIRAELADSGFEVIEIVNGFDTEESNSSSFGVIAKVKS